LFFFSLQYFQLKHSIQKFNSENISGNPTFHSLECNGRHGRVGYTGSVVFVRLFHVLHHKLKNN